METAYKVELNPTQEQKHILDRYIGASRFCYNWGVHECNRHYSETKTGYKKDEARKLFEEEIKSNPDLDWLIEIPFKVRQVAFRQLETAWDNFFRELKKGNPKKQGTPQYKRRSERGSFSVQGSRVSSFDVGLPVPRGQKSQRIKLKREDYIPEDLEDTSNKLVCFSRRAGRYWVSFASEWRPPVPMPEKETGEHETVGIDIGIKEMCFSSDGNSFSNPRPLKKLEKRLKRLQRQLNRKPTPGLLKGKKIFLDRTKDPKKKLKLEKEYDRLTESRMGGEDIIYPNGKTRRTESRNRQKLHRKISELHLRIANIRSQAIHEVTAHYAKNKKVIVRETLNVKGMMKNRKLSKALSDVALGQFDQVLSYKCERYDTELIKADRFYPSSKLCSACGTKNPNLTLSDRTYTCSECGNTVDRDLNAALNLLALTEK